MKTARTILITAIVAVVLVLCRRASAELPGPIAHWEFDEGGGAIAYDSAGGHDGVVYGADWADGFLGGALDFDGSGDYVEVASSDALKLNSAGTVSVWVKPRDLYQHSIVNKQSISDAGIKYVNYWLTFGTYNQISFIIGDGADYVQAIIDEEDLTTDAWQHITGTWDASEIRVYHNGGLADAQANPLSDLMRNDLYPLLIGNYTYIDWYFDGLIDDVRIYDVALSAGEVEELYGEGGGGLIAHWTFDEGSGAIAYDSAGDNDGVVYGAEYVDGVLDGALDFDGLDDYVGVADDDSLTPGSAMTISSWVYINQISWDDRTAIVCKYYYGDRGYYLLLGKNIDPDRSTVGMAVAGSAAASGYVTHGTTALQPGQWYHVATTYEADHMEVYVDGVEEVDNVDAAIPDSIYNNSQPLYIGYDTDKDAYFDGVIDDVRLYGRVLSAGEIEELYGQEPNDGLVAHWKLDEGSGLTAYDSAGDNDGVVYGADWTDGVLDGGLSFDGGGDYVEVGDRSSLDITEQITVAAWIKKSAAGVRDNIVAKHTGDAPFDGFHLVSGDGDTVGLALTIDGSWETCAVDLMHVTSWHHVAGTFDGTEMKMFVDGEPLGSRVVPGSIGVNNHSLYIGRSDPDFGGFFFDGRIDDVRLYERALSGEEVLGLYEEVPQPEAEVYHVDCDAGSDLNDGLSRGTAFATVQKGIDSCVDGDEVVVWPGVYSEAINFLGKAITVRSGGDAAVIEAPGMDAVTFHSGEGAGSVLKNFVIRNSGLAISVNYGTSPTISNLTIVDNDYGIAAYEDSNPDISNCILWDNRDGDMWGCQARYSFVEQEIVTGPVEGLIAQWQFDEGSGPVAGDSIGSNDGTVNGAEWVIGQIGGALSFDGADDYVSIPDSDVFDVNDGDMSIGMWFKTSEYADQTLMKFRDYDDGPLLEIYTSTVYGNLGSRAEPGGAIVAYNAGRVDDGDWHHVAVSLENGTTAGYELYFDGMLVGMSTFSGQLSGWDAIAIGNDADDGGYFNGSIDDVRVYDRAISSLEAYLLYEMSRGGPVAHWKFDEGAGSIAYDSAGSNDGVVYGAQWATGQLGGALHFDGVGDYVDAADDPSLRFGQNDSFSISFWAMPVSTGEIICKRRAAVVHDVFGFSARRGTHEAEDFGFVAESSRSCYDTFSTPAGSAPSGTWHHVVTIYDNKDVKIYLNGELSGTGTFSCNANDGPPDGHLTIGAKSWESTIENYFDGLIDDVRICDRALSAAEVELLFGGGLIGQDDVDTLRPLFADGEAGDYHLVSERGRYWPEHDVWVLDKVSSPCIDAGDPAIEPSGEPMPNGGAMNMGAYGGTEYASMSEWPIFSDYDRNGRSDFGDFAIFCDEWLMMLPWAE